MPKDELEKAIRHGNETVESFYRKTGNSPFKIGAVLLGLNTDQPTILCNNLDFSYKLNALGSALVQSGRHPGLTLANRYDDPVDLMAHTAEFVNDHEVSIFFDAAIEEQINAATYISLDMKNDNDCMIVMVSKSDYLNKESLYNLSTVVKDHFSDLADTLSGLTARKKLLSGRERQCLVCSARGLTEKETAELFGISKNTVRAHLANAREKLQARNKAHAVAQAFLRIELTDLELE